MKLIDKRTRNGLWCLLIFVLGMCLITYIPSINMLPDIEMFSVFMGGITTWMGGVIFGRIIEADSK